MNEYSPLDILGFVSGILGIVAGLVTALWAYIKFVVERGLLPSIQFDVECNRVGVQKGKLILNVEIHLKNLGSTTLIAKDIRLDIRYLSRCHEAELVEKGEKDQALIGRLIFPASLKKDDLKFEDQQLPLDYSEDKAGKSTKRRYRGLVIMPYDTFVQPNVDQLYTYVTAVPQETTCVLVWSSFEYLRKLSWLLKLILAISKWMGLIQWTLKNIDRPHTITRVFWLAE
jgi:hypothetical protein